MIELEPEDEDKVPMYCMLRGNHDIIKITPKILKNEVIAQIFYVTKEEAIELNDPNRVVDDGVIIDDMCCIHDTKGTIKNRLRKLGFFDEQWNSRNIKYISKTS